MQPFLTRNIFLPLWTVFSRSPYLRLVRQYEKDQWLSRENIEQRQLHDLQKIVKYAYERVPYYHRAFDAAGFHPDSLHCLDDMKRIPVLTKEIIRKNFNDLKAHGYAESSMIKMATGGSTGTPLTFFVTKDREVRHAAATALNYEWAELKLGDRLAMLWGAPFEVTRAKSIKGKFENILLGRLLLPTFVLSDEILGRYLQDLHRFRPKVLLGYTSSLRAFASYLERTKQHPPKLTSVISGAETLYDTDRAHFERVFGCPVFNRYGGRDSGAVAAECPENHHLHVNTGIVYAEVDEEGQILITDLWNEGMPFIRYAPEDLGVLQNSLCSCGRGAPYFERIEGRVNDLLQKPNGELVPGEFFPHLFKDIQGVRQFQIIQNSGNTLDLNLVKDPDLFRETDVDYVRQHILEYFGLVTINIRYVDEIPKLSSGKFRFTICNIPK